MFDAVHMASVAPMYVPAVLAPRWYEIPYTPALLLDGHFDVSLTDHTDFSLACGVGFRAFFEDETVGEWAASWDGVQGEMVANVTRRYDVAELAWEWRTGHHPSLAWRAGFMLGMLSALALANRSLALRGVGLLALLVPSCQREEAGRL